MTERTHDNRTVERKDGVTVTYADSVIPFLNIVPEPVKLLHGNDKRLPERQRIVHDDLAKAAGYLG